MNRELRTMEKVINEYAEKNAYDTISRQMIDNGVWSAFLVNHHINFDNSSKQWCFRSAKLEEIAYIKEYGDKTTYEDRTKNIDEFIKNMMESVRAAVNNYGQNREWFLSYSKYLAAPLFKYNLKNSPLIIDELNLNSFDIAIDVHCFDWIPGPDRYHIEEFEFTVPFKDLSSNEKMSKHLYDEELTDYLDYKNHLMDIDEITLAIPGATLDISSISRTRFDNYYYRVDSKTFKRHASYQTDQEVLTTRRLPTWRGMIIEYPRCIQLVRFIYLLKINYMYSEKVSQRLSALHNNHHSDILFLYESDHKAIQWVLSYLSLHKNVIEEREVYRKISKNHLFYKQRNSSDEHNFRDYVSRAEGFETDFLNLLLNHVFK